MIGIKKKVFLNIEMQYLRQIKFIRYIALLEIYNKKEGGNIKLRII